MRNGLLPEYYMGVYGIIIYSDSVRLILKEIDEKLQCSILRDNFYFISSLCCQNVQVDNIIYTVCNQQLSYLRRKCINPVRMRIKGVNNEKINNKFLYSSPSEIKHKIDHLTQNAKRERVKHSKAKAKNILKSVTEKEGVVLSGANVEEIFPENLQELANGFSRKKNKMI